MPRNILENCLIQVYWLQVLTFGAHKNIGITIRMIKADITNANGRYMTHVSELALVKYVLSSKSNFDLPSIARIML